MNINWDDPAARFHLADRVGPDEYNRLFQTHLNASTITTINGYGLRPISTRFGQLIQVMGADRRAFSTQAEAEAYAASLPENDA